MKKPTMLDRIKFKCSGIAWKVFLWCVNMTEEDYWYTIYLQERRNLSKLNRDGDRRTGTTTRIVDNLIQEFFKKGSCEAYDHHPTYGARKNVLSLVIQRLINEHGFEKKDLHIDFSRLIIRKRDEL